MGIGAGSCSWLVDILLLSCIFMGSAWKALLNMYFGVIMIAYDSSNQNVGLTGQFTHSNSIFPCLVWTILQDWVSQFMFISIKITTLNMFDVIKCHKETQVL